jgi:hypothetical protein
VPPPAEQTRARALSLRRNYIVVIETENIYAADTHTRGGRTHTFIRKLGCRQWPNECQTLCYLCNRRGAHADSLSLTHTWAVYRFLLIKSLQSIFFAMLTGRQTADWVSGREGVRDLGQKTKTANAQSAPLKACVFCFSMASGEVQNAMEPRRVYGLCLIWKL